MAATAREDRHLPGHAGGDLLLLHLGRPDGERGVLVHRRPVEALARERAGPVRQPVAVPPVDRALLGGPSRPRARGPGRVQAPEGHRARRVAASGPREGGGHRGHPLGDRASGPHRPRPARHVVHRLPGRQLIRAPPLRPPGELGPAAASRPRAGRRLPAGAADARAPSRAPRRGRPLALRAADPHVTRRPLSRHTRAGPACTASRTAR